MIYDTSDINETSIIIQSDRRREKKVISVVCCDPLHSSQDGFEARHSIHDGSYISSKLHRSRKG